MIDFHEVQVQGHRRNLERYCSLLATELTDLGFFRHTKRSGRVDIRRKGNTFDAIVRDVAVFTLLLSPDAIDFNKPVVVTVNGKQVSGGTIKKDSVTLMRWAARDNDRTSLYQAELKIAVP